MLTNQERRRAMEPFKIQPHSRLQEWVAEEKGYFADEGLDYIFHVPGETRRHGRRPHLPRPIHRRSAVRGQARRLRDDGSRPHLRHQRRLPLGRQHGRLRPARQDVGPRLLRRLRPASTWPPIRRSHAEDLAGREVGVGYHSGSHFSALQALEAFLPFDQINLKFIGSPNDRVAQLLDRRIEAANVFGLQSYIVEQQGFRKVVDTSFMIGFLITGEDVDMEDVEKYFRALQRAQRDIDVEHQTIHPLLPARDGRRVQAARRRARLRTWRAPGLRAVHPGGLRADPPLDEERSSSSPKEQLAEADYRTAVLV